MPYLSASAIVIHYEEALYQVYLYLRLDDDDDDESKDDTDWVKHCITLAVEGIKQRGEDARRIPGGNVLRMTWKI